MVLTVLMFGGTRLMAQDENNAVDPQTTPTIEENLESKNEGEEGASSVDTDKNTNIDSNVANDDKETAKTKTETPEANKTENTENAPKAKQKEKKTQAKEAEKPVEGNGAEDGAKLEAAPAKAPEAVGEGNGEGTGTGKGNDPKKPEVNPDEDKDLNDLKAQIEKEQDPKKKAELQKKYNEKYLDKLGSSDKLDKEVLKRFTDKEKTKKYYELKDEYDKLKEKAKNDKLSQKELDEIKKKIDKLNNELGAYKVPRLLDADEKNAQEKLNNSINEPSLNARESKDPEAQAKLDAYNNAKNALKDALNPDNARTKSEEELKALLEAFDKAEKDLKAGIEKGDIKLNYTTDGKPTVRVFPLINGSVGDELKQDSKKDAPYYIPDNTSIELLVHVNKDDEPKDFTFTIRAVDKGAVVEGETASNLAFLNGEPVELKKNDDGSYSFTVSSKNMNFGIAQLRFNVPGFEGPFHKGFDLEMNLGKDKNQKDIIVSKQFRITKKGYEDEAHLNGPGSDKADDPTKIPKVDAGDTENAKVKEDSAKEVYDFFTYLKKSNTYIDKVEFNSGNGESLPLDSVDITITVPKSGEKNFAEMIHKSGLEYYSLGDGKYQLKLNTKVFGKNLVKEGEKLYLTDKEGKKTEKELTAANLKEVILENAGKKVYVDEKGNAHDIITSEVLEKDGYKVENGKLYKKDDQDKRKFDEIGTFVNGKIEKDGKTYVLEGNNLISYTKEYDVYDGNVANKKDKDGNYKADPDVTPTYEGKQVTIETTKDDGSKENSYGGTIVENAIYDKNGKIFKETGYKGIAGEVAIGSDGKIAEGLFFDPSSIDPEKQTIEVDGKVFHIVKNPVFNKDGYIIDGLEYKTGLSLIDKFGKKMDIDVTKDEAGKYTFTRKVKKGEKVETETKSSGQDGDRTIKVSDNANNNDQILVNNKNEVVKNEEKDGKKLYDVIGNKYYYNGEKFVEAKGTGLKGNKFLAGFEEIVLKPTPKYSYKDEDKTTEIEDFGKKPVYEGSLNPEDYFKVENKIYVKKSQGAGSSQTDYYVSADPNASNEILSEKKIAKIVQTLGNIEKVTYETDIFNAVQNAKFALRFPGFLAGKNVVYNVHADVKATYKKPNPKTGEFEEQSIFTEKDGIKKIDKFFTLKNEKTTNTTFFKNAPDALTKDPAVNLHFFNIFYRGLKDRDRDQLIADLLEIEEDVNKAEKAVEDASKDEKKAKQEAYEKLKKENKEKLELLAKFKYELDRLEKGATFAITDDKKSFKIIKDGKVIELERSLLWEIGFNNSEGSLFPKNPDTEIIIEDHNMDNRLIYDEIIVNDTKENWENLNKAYEDAKKSYEDAKKAFDNADEAGKEAAKTNLDNAKTALDNAKFDGKKEYFFLDQIKDIRFGVNPNFVEGRFVPLGENFNLTGEEILAALNADAAGDIKYGKENKTVKVVIDKDGKRSIEKGGIKFELTRDGNKGQVRIKVLNAFYKHNDSYDASKDDKNYKFSSPVQEAYQKKIDDALGMLGDNGSITKASDVTAFENAFDDLLKVIHKVDSDCYKTIKGKFDEIMTEIKNMSGEGADKKKADALNQVKKTLQDEIPELKLKYLDSKKGAYKNDDMRFNAIHITINSGVSIGGALAPQKTKKLGITSVIVPEIDIPYTDEFGNPLTNKDMYVKAEIEKIKNDKANKGKYNDYLNSEELFREIMSKAYENVNNMSADSFKVLVTIKDETKYAWEKYGAVKGSTLDYKYLAPNGEDIIKDKAGNSINPWYIGKETVDQRFSKKFGSEEYKNKEEYKKLEEKAIDIAAYYMSSQGYDRARYANKAIYKLAGNEEKPGIFGSESDWKKKVCYSGILGKCIEDAGKDIVPGKESSDGKFGAEGKDNADFELTYEPSHDEPDKENPKVDKDSRKEDKNVDISDEKTEKSVDFTIDVTVDKMTKDQKKIADALRPDDKKSEADNYDGYKENGYYEYKSSLIIDFLPEIFKLKDDTELTFEAYKERLMANGANAGFNNDDVFNAWKNGIEYFYTDDLEAEYKRLSKSSDKVDKEKAEVLKKAIEDAKANGKIKKGQKVQAVLAWVPTFEAPHGSENQFTFKLSNVYVNKKKFKDFSDGVIGTNYTNHAAFGDKAKFYFGSTTVNIHKDKHGYINKYLQVLDKDNHVIDKDKADGWFKGNVELKFGDKFNYRIEYKNNKNIVPVPGEAHSKSEIKIEDLFIDGYKGLRPVLNGYVTNDFEFKNQVKVTYKIGKTSYDEDAFRKAIEDGKVKFSDVTSLELEGFYENGATHNFILPMMIPNIDAKIDENGNVYYFGEDGKKHELGEAKKFFDLDKLTKPGKENEMAFDNKVKDSNTVTVYLDKERFIRLFKEFFDVNGNEIKKDRPEMKFDIYQYQTDKEGNPIKDKDGNIIKVKVLDKDGKPLQLVVNEKNKFTDMVDRLPLFKKTITIDKKGNVIENVTNYKYEIKEVDANAYDVEYEILDNGKDQLGFVIKAKNYEKPEIPPEYPKDHPKNVKVKITVNKVWKVLKGGETPSIQVELYANGKATGKIITLGADGSWSASFEDLPAKDKDGKDIVYTVVEVGETNHVTEIGERKFEVSYSIGEDGSITITNKEIPPEEPKNPEDEHEHKDKNKKKPHDDEEERDRTPKKNRIPKTGVNEDLGAIYFAFVLLLGLVFIKKRYLVK